MAKGFTRLEAVWVDVALMFDSKDWASRHVGLLEIDFTIVRNLYGDVHSKDRDVQPIIDAVKKVVDDSGLFPGCNILAFTYDICRDSWLIAVEHDSIPLMERPGKRPAYNYHDLVHAGA